MLTTQYVKINNASMQQEQQGAAVVDPEKHISFLFARCRPAQPRCGAAHAGTAAAAAAANALPNLLTKN